jgi:hypothetical protein
MLATGTGLGHTHNYVSASRLKSVAVTKCAAKIKAAGKTVVQRGSKAYQRATQNST